MPISEVQRYQGKWDARLIATNKRHTAILRSRWLQAFFDATGKDKLADFDSVDVGDFKVLYGRTHAATTVRRAVVEIGSFWKWLIEVQELPLTHIVRGAQERSCIRPHDARRILDMCNGGDFRVAQWVEGRLRGERREVGLSYDQLLRRWKIVTKEAGVPWLTLRRFRRTLRGRVWGRRLLNEYLQAREARAAKAQIFRDSLAYVQLPSGDKRPAISDDNLASGLEWWLIDAEVSA